LRREKKKKTEATKLQRVRKEVFRTIVAIYIKPLASRPPLAFHENRRSSRESRNIKQKNFEAVKHATTIGEGFG